MKKLVIAMTAVLALSAFAALAADDAGTGRPETPADPIAKPGLASPATETYTIGYTTDAVIAHYRSLDHAEIAIGRADILAQGHTLVPVDNLTPGDLAGLDGLVVGVVNAFQSLTAAQIDVIEAFVMGGGNLYFLGENNIAFNDNNIAVGGRFGIGYPAPGAGPLETVLDQMGDHPIIEGPQGPITQLDGANNSPGAYGAMSDPGPHGASIVDFPNGHSACVVIEAGELAPGAGFVIAVAEVNIWDASQIEAADNREFWNNIFAYAPGAVATDAATWSTVKALFE